ncbi:hypothetical protein X743_16935 [Mesorhizobium sp. LNHC252B00]|nr:hypothetical protein X743_16935 [Mesorhizobium sp. LNHC252B00]
MAAASIVSSNLPRTALFVGTILVVDSLLVLAAEDADFRINKMRHVGPDIRSPAQ